MPITQPHMDRLAELGADNRAACFTALREQQQWSLAELANATGLSRPTVRGHIEALLEGGLVSEQERPSAAKGGRPAATFSVVPSGAHIAAFDIALHEHRYLLSDFSGNILTAQVVEVDPTQSRQSRARLVIEHLDDLARSAGLQPSQIDCFSGSIGGLVNSSGAISDELSEAALLSAGFVGQLSAPAVLENDLKAACYAEQRLGRAQGLTDVVYALAWHRVAAGMVLNGAIRHGVHGLAGELHLASDPANPAERAADGWASWPRFLEVVAAADAGDADAAASVGEFCRRAAQQIAYLALSVDPQLVVLGGPLVDRSPSFVAQLKRHLAVLLEKAPTIQFEASGLRTWGAALGALLHGFEALEGRLLGAPTPGPRLHNQSTSPLPIP